MKYSVRVVRTVKQFVDLVVEAPDRGISMDKAKLLAKAGHHTQEWQTYKDTSHVSVDAGLVGDHVPLSPLPHLSSDTSGTQERF